MSLKRLIDDETRRERPALLAASACAAIAGVSAVALLGLSGWFITAAAAAGAAGAALAFNYLLPSAAIRLFAIARTAGRYGERLEGHRAAFQALARIRPKVFAGLAAAPVEDALAVSTGEASARLVQDVDALETLLVRRASVWGAVAAAATGVALAGLASPIAGGCTGMLFVATVVGGRLIARRLSAAPGALYQQASGQLKETYAALIAAAPELVCYGLEDWAADQVDRAAGDLSRARSALNRAEGWQSAFAHVMAALAGVGALALAHQASLPLAALAALAAVATMETAGGLARAFAKDGGAAEAKRRLAPLLATVEPHRNEAAFEAIDLKIPTPEGFLDLQPGTRLAIIGPSGCGKTTLLEQLIRLRAAPCGQFAIGGFDISGVEPASVRALFAYCPQELSLLSGTVRENLALADPDAADDTLWTALSDAGLDRRVERLPQGLDTWIGEGGAQLSGGEKRRLCLARALLKPAPWLLLDEPTEGLDRDTERLVVERLMQRLMKTGQGLIMASHRDGPLALCDSLLRLGAIPLPRAA